MYKFFKVSPISILIILLMVSTSVVAKQQVKNDYVPQDSSKWKEWILEKHKLVLNAPYYNGIQNSYKSSWVSSLDLKVDSKGVVFSQEVTTYTDEWVQIPGQTDIWPMDITDNGKKIVVMKREKKSNNEYPHIKLSAGKHLIKGKIVWEKFPKSLSIPKEAGIIALNLEGKEITNLNVDANSNLWFLNLKNSNKKGEAKRIVDHVNVKVFRLVSDNIPITIESKISLSVSGKEREFTLEKVLPKNSKLLTLTSNLPATIDENGKLSVQVKPGEWEIDFETRQLSMDSLFTTQKVSEEWPKQEIWSYQSSPYFRTSEIKGVATIDPEQTDIPNEWKQFPTFLVDSNSQFAIVQGQRGIREEKDELSFSKNLWLDFSGDAFTVQDEIKGKLLKSGRLSFHPSYKPGSAVVNGTAQLITSSEAGANGVEVREGNIEVMAISKVDRYMGMPLSGWQKDFTTSNNSYGNSGRITLHLPPGWELFYARGIEDVSESFIDNWNIWNTFFAMIIVVIVFKIMGFLPALLMFFTLLFTYHESGSPLYIWINLILTLLILKYLPESKFRKILTIYRNVLYVFLIVIVLAFSINKIRVAVYPQLEYKSALEGNYKRYNNNVQTESAFYDQLDDEVVGKIVVQEKKREKTKRAIKSILRSSSDNYQDKTKKLYGGYDKDANVQTGTAIPTWEWNEITLSTNGPVDKDQKFSLFLISPTQSRIINMFRALAVMLLTGIFILYGTKKKGEKLVVTEMFKKIKTKSIITPIFLFLAVVGANRVEAATEFQYDIPELNELERVMTLKSDCYPHCATVEKCTITTSGNSVTIKLSIDSYDHSYIAIPGKRGEWRPTSVTLQGKKAIVAFDEKGQLTAVVNKGKNVIVIKGKLANYSDQILFPLLVNNAEVISNNWSIVGIDNRQIQKNSNLSFTAIEIDKGTLSSAQKNIVEKQLLQKPADPFFTIYRELILEDNWKVRTVVNRVAPYNKALSLTVPMLKSEKILSDNVKIIKGEVVVKLKAEDSHIEWISTIDITPNISLTAAKNQPWVETWFLTADTKWHTEVTGINSYQNSTTWKPIPGESIAIAITRPKAVVGKTKTINSFEVESNPGKKINFVTIKFSVKSSQGNKVELKLPPNSEVTKLLMDNKKQMISVDSTILKVKLSPGLHNVEVQLKQQKAIEIFEWTVPIEVNDDLANISLKYTLPHDRWLIFIGGPTMGPALMMWGILFVLLIVALVVGKLKVTPLKWWEWFLLFFGMSTISNVGAVFLLAWFIVFKRRETHGIHIKNGNNYNMMQIGLILLTIIALISLVATIPVGLLSNPHTYVVGHGSYSHYFSWYVDFASSQLPRALVVSFPMWVYKAVMLSWSIWLAIKLPSWVKWAWGVVSKDELWKKVEKKKVEKKVVVEDFDDLFDEERVR